MNLNGMKSISINGVEMKKITVGSVVMWIRAIVNWVRKSINPDGTIYNSIGYKDGYRIRSGGAEGEAVNTTCTGFIKVAAGDVVRFSGRPWFDGTSANNALNASDAGFNNIGQFTMGQNAQYGIFLEAAWKPYSASSIVEEKPGVWRWVVPPTESGVAYIRITAADATGATSGADMIVTINEDIA